MPNIYVYAFQHEGHHPQINTKKCYTTNNNKIRAKFANLEDYDYVLSEGPWMIANHYLTIRKRCPSFQPEEDAIKNLAVWANQL